MSDTSPMTREADQAVRVRLWAGARAAAGTDEVRLADLTLPSALSAVLGHLTAQVPALSAIVQVSTVLRDGHACGPTDLVRAGDLLEVLPPFAGG